MPNTRRQTVISAKGLITLPEPWRTYHGLEPKDGIIVKWNKVLLVFPESMEDDITEAENAIIVALLERRITPDLVKALWTELSEEDRGDLQSWMKGKEVDGTERK